MKLEKLSIGVEVQPCNKCEYKQNASEWVTPDALPPEQVEVLCWYEYFRYGSYNRMYQTYGIGYCLNGKWCGEVANGVKSRVIAWQPLPKPPERKKL